jgi:hypothetical protein
VKASEREHLCTVPGARPSSGAATLGSRSTCEYLIPFGQAYRAALEEGRTPNKDHQIWAPVLTFQRFNALRSYGHPCRT